MLRLIKRRVESKAIVFFPYAFDGFDC